MLSDALPDHVLFADSWVAQNALRGVPCSS